MKNSILFSPYTIRNITLKNRIVMSPMCMYSVTAKDGKPNNWHYTHYTSRAVGQTGLIITEASAVTPEGRISYQDMGIWSDEHIPGLQHLVQLVHEQGAHIGIQLAHAGRKAMLDEAPLAPSAIAFEGMKTPEALSKESITKLVQAFQQAARRARAAGMDVIEIHAAHGYLINEFLSPLSNTRTDEYGGNADNRYRFLGEVIDAVRKEWDGPLFCRISANEYTEGGTDMATFIHYAQRMKEQGVDLIDCSSGGVVPATINAYPGYQVPAADAIRKEAGIATGAVGLITTGTQAEEILSNGRADLVFIARALLRDPYWPRTAAAELAVPIAPPEQYLRGWK
ncbi:NADPH2 dehydrogenase [Filimonas zeae]|nr:NADPH dehydrogenase NamA [Filimonas zeae]MDR6342194.1 NADPH2 dehydrogenase [Filimonas zeae]